MKRKWKKGRSCREYKKPVGSANKPSSCDQKLVVRIRRGEGKWKNERRS
jgi:hypothetical protein